MEEIIDLDELSSELYIEKYPHYLPEEECVYFSVDRENIQLHKDNSELPVVTIGISFYNESAIELRRILVSLADQIEELKEIAICQVVFVSDGYEQMAEDSQRYLKFIFCKDYTEKDIWAETMAHLKESQAVGDHLTYIIQRVKYKENQHQREEVTIPGAKDNLIRSLPLSLILKSRNRRKHNSCKWICSAFASQAVVTANEKYVFLSDCGTLFEAGCLKKLVKYMQAHPKCVGCTGRQRVMSAYEQDCNEEKWLSIAKFFRLVQMADYESTYPLYMACFSAIGCLPVLPGPCSLYRLSALNHARTIKILDPLERLLTKGKTQIKETALDHFDNIVLTAPNDTNIVVENVKLAEDRIPSYAVITHGPPGAYTTWVDTTFKFQAETELGPWVFQRRRWINGAFSCYIWNTLTKPHLIFGSNQNLCRKLLIWICFLCQLLNYTFSTLSPAIIGSAFYIALVSLFSLHEGNIIIINCITVFYGLFTLLFIWLHRYFLFIKPLFYLMTIFNALVISFILIACIQQSWLQTGNFTIFLLSAIIISLPFVMALISLNIKSFVYLLLSYIPYLLFLPTLIGSFTLYSMARLADVTWGNRCSSIASGFKGITDKELELLKNNLASNAAVALVFITLANILLELLLLYFYKNQRFMLISLFILFTPIIFQATISCFYFLIKHITCTTCKQRYY